MVLEAVVVGTLVVILAMLMPRLKTELSRIDGVLSAGSELARAESTEEIVAQTDRLRDLVQHLQTAAGQPPSPPSD